MKAEDLRIGNLVMIENELLGETKGRTYKVTGIQGRFEIDFPDSNSVISLSHADSLRTYSQFNEFIQPIPLTEEWLLKFEYSEKNIQAENEVRVYSDFLFIWKPGYKYWYIVSNESLDYLTKIEFIHEYQNFIFALRGKEPIIKRLTGK